MTAWLLSFGEAIETPAVDEEEVEPAVVVIVVKRQAAACGLQEVFILALCTVGCCDVEAGLLCDVDVADSERRAFNRRLRAGWRWRGLCLVSALLRANGFLWRLCRLLRWRGQRQNVGKRQNECRSAE